METNKTENASKFKLTKANIFQNLAVILLAIICAVLLRLFVFENIKIEQHSMEPTIHDKQIVTVFKIGKAKRGDIIVFKSESYDNHYLIKRIVATAGDTVWIDESGDLNVSYEINGNSKIITKTESYIAGKNIVLEKTYVGEGELFVLGDNRQNSFDSQEFGAIKESSILGKVLFVKNNKW